MKLKVDLNQAIENMSKVVDDNFIVDAFYEFGMLTEDMMSLDLDDKTKEYIKDKLDHRSFSFEFDSSSGSSRSNFFS